jgi:hypothetical protein
MAAAAWDMVSEKRKPSSNSGSGQSDLGDLSRTSTKTGHTQPKYASSSDEPLVPERVMPGAKFGGFGFGKQGEKAAAERGWKISKPMESLPSESAGPCPVHS